MLLKFEPKIKIILDKVEDLTELILTVKTFGTFTIFIEKTKNEVITCLQILMN